MTSRETFLITKGNEKLKDQHQTNCHFQLTVFICRAYIDFKHPWSPDCMPGFIFSLYEIYLSIYLSTQLRPPNLLTAKTTLWTALSKR